MSKAQASLSDFEADLQDQIALTFADPLAFVLMAFDWGHGELKAHSGPDDWQRHVMQEIGSGVITASEALRIAIASGHGIGKSALVSWIILWAMSTRPHLAGVVTANTRNQLESKTWRELSLWHKRAINSHWFNWTASKFSQTDNPDTWFVSAVPWTKERSEAFAGLHAEHVLMIFDEASAIDDVIWEVSEGAMTTPGAIWCAFGNPTRNSGRFRECFGKFRHRWLGRQIDSRTAKMANNSQIEQWVQDYGEDSDFVRVRVRGIFPRAGSCQFIDSDMVAEARQRVADGHGPKVLGVDVARFGDDQTVFCLRQGAKVEIVARYRGLDTMQTAARVAEMIGLHKPHGTFIDGVGVGGGVVDRVKQLGFTVTDVNAGSKAMDSAKYFNLRAEMWGKCRDWLNAGGCLPNDTELVDDLTAPEYGFDPQNRIQIERKDDMKKRGLGSPDSADALCLTFAMPVHETIEDDYYRGRGGGWMGA